MAEQPADEAELRVVERNGARDLPAVAVLGDEHRMKESKLHTHALFQRNRTIGTDRSFTSGANRERLNK